MGWISTKLLGYVSGGLLIAVIVCGIGWKLTAAKAQHNYDQWQLSETRLAVSNASIERLQAGVEQCRSDAQARGEALDEARSQAAQDAIRFARDRQDLQGRVLSLTALVRDREGECAVDDAVLEALDND